MVNTKGDIKMIRFLFQGDSITDANRDRDREDNYGYGYPNLVAAELMYEYPGKYEFINKGISGDRIVDVYSRIKEDIINLRPDYMSILIGVNDVWHELNEENGVAAPKFEMIYSMLVEEIKDALPNIKIFVLEPFVLKGPGTERYFDEFLADLKLHAQAAKNVAEKYGLTFIPLQDKFDEASKLMPPTYWAADGVHPTAAGHALIKDTLVKAL